MAIPKTLLDQIIEGNVVLFLGAGASFGALNKDGQQIPSGQQLSNMIAQKFLDDSYLDQPLTFVSELANDQKDIFSVQRYLYDLFESFQPSEAHKLIPTFKWRSLYTTNYDLIIERAYDCVPKKIQELNPIFRNTRIQNVYKNESSLPYFKIHGCITYINDRTLPLILTPDQYISHKENRHRLFDKLLEEAHDFTFVFVGYSFADIDIRTILQILDKEKEGRPRYYMIGPNIREAEASFWETKRISSLKMTFEVFLNEIDKAIPKNSGILSKARPVASSPIFNHFQISIDKVKPSESFSNFLYKGISKNYLFHSIQKSYCFFSILSLHFN